MAMHIALLVAYLWLSIAGQGNALPRNNSLPASFQEYKQSLNNSRLLQEDNVPRDFRLLIDVAPQTRIYVPILWLLLFKCMTQVGELTPDLLAEQFECRSGSLWIAIKPEPTSHIQPFPMVSQHMVWAIQRLAEDIYRTTRYSELNAEIGCYGATIGRLMLRADPETPGAVELGSSNSTLQSLPDIPNSGNWTGPAGSIGNLTADEHQVHIVVEALDQPPVAIPRLKIFLAMIRAIARLAAFHWSLLADTNWLYEDDELGFRINYGRNIITQEVIVWRDLARSFISFFNKWQSEGRVGHFYEAEAFFFTTGNPNLFGRMQITKLITQTTLNPVQTS